MGLFSKVLKPVTNLVSDVIGGTMNAVTGVSDTAKQSYNQSLALMDKENANNIKLWNMQNEYNAPSAQIARMKDAGIDVNPMTYAVGNGNMSTTASSISTATPHMPSYSSAGNPISMLFSVLGGIDQLKNNEMHRKLVQTQIDNWEHDHASPYKDLADAVVGIFSNKKTKGSTAFGNFLQWFNGHLAHPNPRKKPSGNAKLDKKEEKYYEHKNAYDYLYRM